MSEEQRVETSRNSSSPGMLGVHGSVGMALSREPPSSGATQQPVHCNSSKAMGSCNPPSTDFQKETRSIVESATFSRAVEQISCSHNLTKYIALVEALAQQMVRRVCGENGSPTAWVKVIPFGSAGLNATIIGSDIDLALYCHESVSQAAFLAVFPAVLLERGYVVVVVASARVPVVKILVNSISVDVVCVSMSLPAPPLLDELLSPNVFSHVSRETRAAVNGVRAVLEIRRRLPVPEDYFISALKAVKYWAARRGVCGNIFGFPNGVALAVMVLRVCQAHPEEYPSGLFRAFFRYFVKAMYDQDRIETVYVTESLHPQPGAQPHGRIVGMLEGWDRSSPANRHDLLPVINPATPYVNTCHSVGRSGVESFYKEVTRAHCVLLQSKMSSWDVWQPYIITADYATFIIVELHCGDGSDTGGNVEKAFGVWSAYVSSRLRFLVYSVETLYEARPHPRRLLHATLPSTCGCRFAIGVRQRHQVSKESNASPGGGQRLTCDLLESAFWDFRVSIAQGRQSVSDKSVDVDTRLFAEPSFSVVDSTHPSLPAELHLPLL